MIGAREIDKYAGPLIKLKSWNFCPKGEGQFRVGMPAISYSFLWSQCYAHRARSPKFLWRFHRDKTVELSVEFPGKFHSLQLGLLDSAAQ